MTGFKPKQVIFNYQNKTDTDEILQNYNKTQSAIKVLIEKRRKQVENENKTKNVPTNLAPGENVYIKVNQRITKDKNPFKIAKVTDDNELTFKDSYGVKIHKNRIKK